MKNADAKKPPCGGFLHGRLPVQVPVHVKLSRVILVQGIALVGKAGTLEGHAGLPALYFKPFPLLFVEAIDEGDDGGGLADYDVFVFVNLQHDDLHTLFLHGLVTVYTECVGNIMDFFYGWTVRRCPPPHAFTYSFHQPTPGRVRPAEMSVWT